MRVLYVANNYPPNIIGGAELIAHRHAAALSEQGVDCSVFAGDHSGTRTPLSIHHELFEGLKVFRVALSSQQTSYERSNFRNATIDRLFTETLDEISPNVVHFHNLPGLSVDLIGLAKSRGCRTVLTVHDHWGFCHRQTLTTPDGAICRDYSACHKCLPQFLDHDGTHQPIEARNQHVKEQLKQLDLLLSPSAYLARAYLAAQAAPAQIAVLGYGTDLLKFFPDRAKYSRTGPLRFGVACYLGEHKGIRTVLNAVDKMPSTAPITLLFAGKGPLEGLIREFITNHRNGHLVSYAGDVVPNRMRDYYRSIDVFILASVWPENQPLTIIEAMACGVPVIATNCGGNPELVQDKIVGRLVPPGDPDSLAEAILSYAANPSIVQLHGERSCRKISCQSLQKSVVRLKRLYTELCTPAAPF